jgi:hypothetical protein
VHAALIKYGLRAYSSMGLTPEAVLRAMDRLYLENSNFEKVESRNTWLTANKAVPAARQARPAMRTADGLPPAPATPNTSAGTGFTLFLLPLDEPIRFGGSRRGYENTMLVLKRPRPASPVLWM